MDELKMVSGFLISIYALAVYKVYLDTFLRKQERFHAFSGWSVFFLWQYFINLECYALSPGLNLTCTMTVAVGMALLSYKDRYGRCIMFAVLYVAIWMLLEGVVEFGIDILFGQTHRFFLISVVCSQSALLLIVAAIRYQINTSGKTVTKGAEELFFLILPMAGVFLYYALYKMVKETGPNDHYSSLQWLVVAAVALLVMNLSLYPAYLFVMEALHNYKSLALYKGYIELFQQEQFLEEAAAAEILELRHDMKQHLVYLRKMLLEDLKEEAVHTIETLIGSAERKGALKSNTGNIVVDALVNHAWLRAVERNIDFQVKLDGLSGIRIPNSELCILLGNALDNALEASEYVPEDQRAIWVEISYMKHCLLISLKNRYVGELNLNAGKMRSRKAGKGHGIGIFSMKKAAARLDGILTIKDDNGIFSLEIWIPSG